MYYLRKFSKINTLSKIEYSEDVFDTPSDLLKQEFSTTQNTLSFWKFDSFNNLDDSLKAVLLSCTKIEKSVFIIIDDKLLTKYNLRTDDTEPGKTGYLGYDKLHVNLCDLTYRKIGSVLNMIKDVSTIKEYRYELTKDEVKRLIKDVCISGKYDETNTNDQLKADINKYMLNI